MKRTKATDQSPRMPGRRKTLVFKLIACCLPVILLIAIELLLRAFGYGHDLRLFVQDPDDSESLVMNRYASEKFFSNTANATIGNAETFKKEKDPGTLRFFVLGESTTIGYPYMHNGSFHRMLQYRLMLEYPQTNIEVINLSLTAVNSFTVLDFAKKVVDLSPDAVLIYCGHNEYYGAMGAATSNEISSNPFISGALLILRGFRSWQLLNNVYGALRGNAKNYDEEESLMRRMAAGQRVPYGSAIFNKGIEQFRNNMEAVCRIFSQRNIPVFISNLVSNEKSMAPLMSASDSNAALACYHKAQKYYQAGAYSQAKKMFLQAKDEDLLRFRAPEQLNEIIATLCATYPKTFLVDSRALFEKNSEGGILGDETLLEHVHPNLFGYALLSDAFYHSIKQQNIPVLKAKHTISFEYLRNNLPVTRVDSIKGAYETAVLKMHWPFHDTARQLPVQTFEERLASQLLTRQRTWNNMLDTLMPYYVQQGNFTQALKVAESAILEYPHDVTFYVFAANCARQLKDALKSEIYLAKAFRLSPSSELANQLVDFYLSRDEPDRCFTYLDYLIHNNRSSSNLIAVKKMLTEVISSKKQLGVDFSKPVALQIAAVYNKLGYDSIASRYINMQSGNKKRMVDAETKL